MRRWDDAHHWTPESEEAPLPADLRWLFEQAIRYRLDQADAAAGLEALQLSEEMRERLAPRPSFATHFPSGDELLSLAEGLPPATAVVEFVVVENRALAWVLTRAGIRQVDLTPGAEFGPLLRQLLAARRRQDLESWRSVSEEIRRRWVEPVLSSFAEPVHRLLLVPDEELFGVPFRGLWSRDTSRYLDEEFVVSVVPSLGTLLRARDTRLQDREKSRGQTEARDPGSSTALVVGFSEFSLPNLRRLPGAEEEVRAIRERYGAGRLDRCTGNDWDGLRACLGKQTVVHLTTHASARSGAWIAFPEEQIDLARLWKELPELPATRLVVLSACESAASLPGSEGLGGLARPFLARNVDAVVGSLWRLDDDVAVEHFPEIHSAFLEEGDAARALQVARQRLHGWQERPWDWSAVVAVTTTVEDRDPADL
jgi:CHAT domain-containing protein